MPSIDEIEAGLTHTNADVRLEWARRSVFVASHEMAERGLADPDIMVRQCWIRRRDVVPLPERVERGLTDAEWKIRRAWARREDWTPTPDQVRRGLCDVNHDVRVAWLERRDWTIGADSPNLGGVLLYDRSIDVRAAWIKRRDAPINEYHKTLAANHDDWRIRTAVASREDLHFDAAAINKGITDPNAAVRAIWATRAASLYPGLPWERYVALTA